MSQDKKYQVFISSTYEDLKVPREYAMKAILEMGDIPIGMELFQASNETQWKLIQRRIDDSDFYILILAHRYGSTDSKGISYTEKEYDYAIKKKVPVLSFILDSNEKWEPKFIDKETETKKKLDAFKAKATKNKLVRFWKNEFELNSNIKSALIDEKQITNRRGWVRYTDMTEALTQLARLSEENRILVQRNSELEFKIKNLAEQKNAKTDIEDVIKEIESTDILFELRKDELQNVNDDDLIFTINLLEIVEICEDTLHQNPFYMRSLMEDIESHIIKTRNISFRPLPPSNHMFFIRRTLLNDISGIEDLIRKNLLSRELIDRIGIDQYVLTELGKKIFKKLLKLKM